MNTIRRALILGLAVAALGLGACAPPPPAPPPLNPDPDASCRVHNNAANEVNVYAWDYTGAQITESAQLKGAGWKCLIRWTVRAKQVTVGGITTPADVLLWASPAATVWSNNGQSTFIQYQFAETPGSGGVEIVACLRDKANTHCVSNNALYGVN